MSNADLSRGEFLGVAGSILGSPIVPKIERILRTDYSAFFTDEEVSALNFSIPYQDRSAFKASALIQSDTPVGLTKLQQITGLTREQLNEYELSWMSQQSRPTGKDFIARAIPTRESLLMINQQSALFFYTDNNNMQVSLDLTSIPYGNKDNSTYEHLRDGVVEISTHEQQRTVTRYVYFDGAKFAVSNPTIVPIPNELPFKQPVHVGYVPQSDDIRGRYTKTPDLFACKIESDSDGATVYTIGSQRNKKAHFSHAIPVLNAYGKPFVFHAHDVYGMFTRGKGDDASSGVLEFAISNGSSSIHHALDANPRFLFTHHSDRLSKILRINSVTATNTQYKMAPQQGNHTLGVIYVQHDSEYFRFDMPWITIEADEKGQMTVWEIAETVNIINTLPLPDDQIQEDIIPQDL